MHEDSFIIILQVILWMIPIVTVICFLFQKDDDETDDCSIFIDNKDDDWF
jgi:hypothetical protein